MNDQDPTALHQAARAGDCAAIEELRDQGADVNVTDKNGHRALHLAAGEGHYAAVDLLLRYGADPNALDTQLYRPYEETALHHAASKGHCNVMRLLLDRGADVNTVESYLKFSVLHAAAKGGCCEALSMLLDLEMDIDAQDKCVGTPLLYAAACGKNNAIKLLLDAGANLDAVGLFCGTALHLAAQNGHFDTVSLLLDCGVNVAAVTNDGYTALHLAAKNGEWKIVRLLCSRGGDINGKNDDHGDTALRHATMSGPPSVIDLVLSLGARLDERDCFGDTLLHSAILKLFGSLDTVVHLLSLGIDVNARNNRDETPLHIAVRWMDSAVVEALLMAGAKCDVKDVYGYTPEDIALSHTDADLHGIFVDHKSHYPNLKRSCRMKIVRALGNQGEDKISQLGLPQRLKDYLLFKQ